MGMPLLVRLLYKSIVASFAEGYVPTIDRILSRLSVSWQKAEIQDHVSIVRTEGCQICTFVETYS